MIPSDEEILKQAEKHIVPKEVITKYEIKLCTCSGLGIRYHTVVVNYYDYDEETQISICERCNGHGRMLKTTKFTDVGGTKYSELTPISRKDIIKMWKDGKLGKKYD